METTTRRRRGSSSMDHNMENQMPSFMDDDNDLKIPKGTPTITEAYIRGRWLLMLLVLQSSSSFVLDKFQELIQKHLVVTLFLTMLVGAGGNAGNQSAIKVIQGFAKGELKPDAACFWKVISQQGQVGLLIGTAMSLAGFLRVYFAQGEVQDAIAISAALFVIVLSSVVIGSGLPFCLAKVGIDPANAGTTIQVIMDVLGVAVTCAICTLLLDM